MGVGLREREIRDTGPLAQRIDRQFYVVLGQRSQFGFRLGIVEKHLGGAEQRQVVRRSVVRIVLGRLQVFHQLVTGHRRGEVRGRFGRIVHTLVTGCADRLSEAAVAVPALVW